jgi:hypothetical protein
LGTVWEELPFVAWFWAKAHPPESERASAIKDIHRMGETTDVRDRMSIA